MTMYYQVAIAPSNRLDHSREHSTVAARPCVHIQRDPDAELVTCQVENSGVVVCSTNNTLAVLLVHTLQSLAKADDNTLRFTDQWALTGLSKHVIP